MSKKPAKIAAAEPKKRSKLILALAAIIPLLLAGGGYAGWMFYFQAPKADAQHAGEEGHGGAEKEQAAAHTDVDLQAAADHMKVAGVPRDIAAESSFTHSYALSVLLREKCGPSESAALQEASNIEAVGDGLLAQLSWEAAARRTQLLKAKSCGYLLGEIADADAKAAKKLAAEKTGQSSGH